MHFLTKHGFCDANSPRQLGASARVKMETVYPIHVAADVGLLLFEGSSVWRWYGNSQEMKATLILIQFFPAILQYTPEN